MRFTPLSSILMLGAALLAQGSLPLPSTPHHLHESWKNTKINIQKSLLSLSLQGTSRDVHSSRRTQICEQVGSEEFMPEFDALGKSYSDDINCTEDLRECNWDLSEGLGNGAFDVATKICNEYGGVFYAIDAFITCEDGTSFTLIASPFSCLSNCDAESIALYPVRADHLIGKFDTTCSFVSFQAFVVGNETEHDHDEDPDHHDQGDHDHNDEDEDEDDHDHDHDHDDYNNGGGFCYPVTTEEYQTKLQLMLFGYNLATPICEESALPNPPNCEIDLSDPLEDGAMDNILGPCNDAGGELYLLSFGLDCGNDGKTYYWHLPNCLANCNELFFDAMLNENAAGNCTYYGVDDVIVYGDGDGNGNGNGENEDEDGDADEEDDNSTGEVCAQVIDETYAQMAYLTLFISLQDSISCEDESQTICTIDLADELEGGKITTLLPFCTNAGGDLYISTFGVDCGDDGITTIKNFPFCISNCNVNYLKELIFYVGGNAGSDAGDLLGLGNGNDVVVDDDNDEVQTEDEDCIFSVVDEIYRYSSDQEDEDERGDHHDDHDHHDEGDNHHDDHDHHDEEDNHHDDHDHHDEGDDHHDDHDHHDEGDDHHDDHDHHYEGDDHHEDNHDYHDGDDSHDHHDHDHDHDHDNRTDHQSPKAPKAIKALKKNKIKKAGKKFKKDRNSKQE